MSEPQKIIIAGAGQAAAQTAQSLRQAGYTGSITLIGDEPFLPYERPPLSKDYLSGKRDADRLSLRKPDFWTDKRVNFLLGRRVVHVSRSAHTVTLDDGAMLPYDRLVWATGGRPRRLACPGADLSGVHHVRTIADIDALKAELRLPERRVVIVGGGYIGLEGAAVLRGLGHHVTILEMQDRLLARVTSPVISDFFLNLHRRHGADVRLSTGVTALVGWDGRVNGVQLSTGEVLAADIVIVGVGIIPNVEPLAAAGLDCPNGVAVDESCRTHDSDILAIGDCALYPNPFASHPVRLESVPNAVEQAKVAAETILGRAQPGSAMPWFWSDQYDVKIQTAGLLTGYDEMVVRGSPETASFSIAYLRDKRLIAMDCVNMPKDFIQSRTLIMNRTVVNIARINDPGIELKAALDMDNS